MYCFNMQLPTFYGHSGAGITGSWWPSVFILINAATFVSWQVPLVRRKSLLHALTFIDFMPTPHFKTFFVFNF